MFNFPLPQDEEPMLIAKSHWSRYLGDFLKTAGVLAILGIIVTLARNSWWEEKWGQAVIIIFSFGALIFLLISFWKKFLTTYIVTRCRLIDITQSKALKREITEITLDEIEETKAIKEGIMNRIFKTGRVAIRLKENRGVVVLYDVGNPEKIKETLDGIQEGVTDIMGRKSRECSVILEDSAEKKVPLSYSYYGDRAKRLGRKNGDLVIKRRKK
jgi:hypothetical protein